MLSDAQSSLLISFKLYCAPGSLPHYSEASLNQLQLWKVQSYRTDRFIVLTIRISTDLVLKN